MAALRADVYDDYAVDGAGVGVGVEEGVPAAHGEAGEDAFCDAEGFREGSEVFDKALPGIAVYGPATAAVAALV